ncbi:MAG TPA: zf-HC2 domain-containing protein [Gemmataceae bacterium]|nr:zf-HC2 domain-containing protein [Gemmataceae bacterium]
MSEWTCNQAADWIDLYTAGEADSPTRAAVGRHLKACPACDALHQHTVQLIGLLDQREQEPERLKRLWSRLEAAPQRVRQPMRRRLWAAAALAASVLLCLSTWFGSGSAPIPIAPQLTVALKSLPERFAPGPPEAMMVRPEMAMTKSADGATRGPKEGAEPIYPVAQPPGRGALTPIPVELALDLRNPDREPLRIDFKDENTRLLMDLLGPGVLDDSAPGAEPPLAHLDEVRIAPGGTDHLEIHQLAYGGRGDVHYLYWTKPGEYTLTITLRAWVRPDPPGEAREIVVTSSPIKVPVR